MSRRGKALTALCGALTYCTKVLAVRWDIMSPKQFEILRERAWLTGYGMDGLLFPLEEEELRNHAPGAWERFANYEFITLWKYQGT
jgi:hypothetical protein